MNEAMTAEMKGRRTMEEAHPLTRPPSSLLVAGSMDETVVEGDRTGSEAAAVVASRRSAEAAISGGGEQAIDGGGRSSNSSSQFSGFGDRGGGG